jgi:hypothetical protein
MKRWLAWLFLAIVAVIPCLQPATGATQSAAATLATILLLGLCVAVLWVIPFSLATGRRRLVRDLRESRPDAVVFAASVRSSGRVDGDVLVLFVDSDGLVALRGAEKSLRLAWTEDSQAGLEFERGMKATIVIHNGADERLAFDPLGVDGVSRASLAGTERLLDGIRALISARATACVQHCYM